MAKIDKALSGVFGVPEISSFPDAVDPDDDEPDMLPAVQATSVAENPASDLVPVASDSAQIDADTEFVKNRLKSLLKKGEDALESLIEIAKEEERASHFEALGGMINQLSNVAMGILEAESKRQKLKVGLGEQPGTTVTNNTQNNIVFTGTTAELQAMLHKHDVIDVEATEQEDEE